MFRSNKIKGAYAPFFYVHMWIEIVDKIIVIVVDFVCVYVSMYLGGELMKTVTEIAAIYGVTTMAVRHWLADGLPHKKEKVIGVKTRIVIDPVDVERYHAGKADK